VSFELSSRVYPGFAVVGLAGELDAAGADAAAVAIQAGIGAGQRVIVDLEALQFAACHALGVWQWRRSAPGGRVEGSCWPPRRQLC
jgi:anti-anti-sigma factor